MSTSSELPSVNLFLYYINMSCPIQGLVAALGVTYVALSAVNFI
jgi:hypothetical protein